MKRIQTFGQMTKESKKARANAYARLRDALDSGGTWTLERRVELELAASHLLRIHSEVIRIGDEQANLLKKLLRQIPLATASERPFEEGLDCEIETSFEIYSNWASEARSSIRKLSD